MDVPAVATIPGAVALFVLFRMLSGTIDSRAFLERRGFVCVTLLQMPACASRGIAPAHKRFQSFTGADCRGINLPCATSMKSSAANA
jgi:hypothetical protein